MAPLSWNRAVVSVWTLSQSRPAADAAAAMREAGFNPAVTLDSALGHILITLPAAEVCAWITHKLQHPALGYVAWFDSLGNEYLPSAYTGQPTPVLQALLEVAYNAARTRLLSRPEADYTECRACCACHLTQHMYKARNGSVFCHLGCIQAYAS